MTAGTWFGLGRPPRLPDLSMKLDALLGDYSFGEHHETFVAAPRESVFHAVRTVTAGEIRFFRFLTWLRSPRLGRGRPSILNAPPDWPILEVALETGFVLLHEEVGREIVVGMIVCCGPRHVQTAAEFWAAGGSVARAVMNFHLGAVPGGTRLVTQTRIQATDARARRRFGAYWLVVHPGSAFIRHRWLAAIRHRAEASLR